MKRYDNIRINLVFVFVFLAAGLIGYRLFVLSYVKHNLYSRTAEAQRENINNILARGNIYFQPDFIAGTNKKFLLAHVVPKDVDVSKRDYVIEQLVQVLSIDKAELAKVLDSNAPHIKVLARNISNEQGDKIKSLKTKGVGVSYEMNRFYPAGELAANVIGFLGYNGNIRAGQYGIEGYYDKELFGNKWQTNDYINPANLANSFSFIKKIISVGNKTPDEKNVETISRPSDIVLTIDKNIQLTIENKLDELVKKWEAVGGTVIVQDPNTGKILAMADRPTFDPNNYSQSDQYNFLNRGVQEVFEPGSSFKPITMAIGLDLGKINPQMTYTDTGSIEIAGYKIKNFSEKIFGLQTMTQVLEKSINTGAMYVENLVGDDNFLNYLINMGFGQKTNIDLPGEVNGDITNLYSGRKINFLTASFGQGIAVTPIQLINAYSAIANGGKLLRPYVVEKIIKDGGEEVATKPEIVSIPISEKTANRVKSMLVSVVDNGFDKALIKGYDIAGKTGTAQIPDGKGGYLENEFIHDFVGFAPAFNPKFVILIKLDKPKGITFAADSLSPTARDITSFLLNYYNIPPTRQ